MKTQSTLTQLELARQGVVSDKMKQAAATEGMDPELLRQRIANDPLCGLVRFGNRIKTPVRKLVFNIHISTEER